MKKRELEFFAMVLNQRLDELLRQAGNAMSELVSQNTHEIEYLDQASVEISQSLRLRIRSRESRLIKKIRQALDRVENRSFGTCDACGEDISIKRLEARPVTTKCIDCKEEEEKLELMALTH